MHIPGTNIYIQPVDWSLVKFPPDPEPPALPAPSNNPSFSHPFKISDHIYNALLSPQVPFTVAAVYAVTAKLLNSYNAQRGNKPWSISKTRGFQIFVVLHNIFLAVYSAWTFIGMLNAFVESVPSARGRDGLAGMVDGLCKIHGPRGLGNAATYNVSTGAWGITNRALHLGTAGTPEESDVGRMWNEGLAFYGWLFYISKFYEVFDTLIILAKGKRSSTLQTYHHAGAMMSMWVGMRYMAPPIWMFVFINSAIHAMMYTYYTLSALGYRVPLVVKRTLTTMQIAQFVFGASFAFAHLFVAYKVQVSVPYLFSTADLTSVPADVSSTASSAIATASAGVGAWLKKVALRAAGSEGPAERVQNDKGEAFGIDAIHAAKDLKDREEVRFRDEFRTIHCTDTSGQVFAILFNCIYLLPLTALFVRFFIKSYINRVRRNSSVSATRPQLANEAHKDATKGFERTVNQEPGITKGNNDDTKDTKQGTKGNDQAAKGQSKEAKEKLAKLGKEVDAAKGDIQSTLKDVKDKKSDVQELQS